MKYLSWVKTMLATPAKERKEWVDEIIRGFHDYRGKSKMENKTQKYLSDVLESDYELVGLVPGIEYIKVDGPQDELECVWQHPHMNPQLLLKHKTLPVFIIAGPSLRFNDSVLVETGARSEKVRGITG